MATSLPTGFDSLVNRVAGNRESNPSHPQQHVNGNDAISASEAKLGGDGSAVASSIDYLRVQGNVEYLCKPPIWQQGYAGIVCGFDY